jgi:hypothetical protein
MTAHALASMNEWFAFAHFVLGEPPGANDQLDPNNDHAVGVLVDLWYHALYGEVLTEPGPLPEAAAPTPEPAAPSEPDASPAAHL